MEFERRKYVRFFVKDNIFAALRNGFKKVGKVHDVGIKGVGFSYLSETTETDVEGQNSHVDIFLSGNGFHIYNIPCRIVYEFRDVVSDESYPLKMSRCGLHFGKLSEMQLDLIKFIIAKHTVKTRPVNEIHGMTNYQFKTI